MKKSEKMIDIDGEKNSLVFRYVQLAIRRKRGENGDVKKTLEDLRQKLGMSHDEIIQEAQKKTMR